MPASKINASSGYALDVAGWACKIINSYMNCHQTTTGVVTTFLCRIYSGRFMIWLGVSFAFSLSFQTYCYSSFTSHIHYDMKMSNIGLMLAHHSRILNSIPYHEKNNTTSSLWPCHRNHHCYHQTITISWCHTMVMDINMNIDIDNKTIVIFFFSGSTPLSGAGWVIVAQNNNDSCSTTTTIIITPLLFSLCIWSWTEPAGWTNSPILLVRVYVFDLLGWCLHIPGIQLIWPFYRWRKTANW